MKALTLHERLARNFATQPDMLLTGALLAAAAVLVCVALLPRHRLLKAAALAWVLLP